MPVFRNKKRNIRRKSSTRSRSWIKYVLIFLFISLFICIIATVYKLRNSVNLWSDDQKLAVVVDDGDKGVVVVLLDPIHNEIHKFYYPESLQIETARNLGSWKIGSLWRLGANEKVGGMLLAHSVNKSLMTPVSAWADSKFLALLDKNFLNIPKNLIIAGNVSNLSLIDRIKIARLSLRVDDSKVMSYTSDNMNYIAETKLNDGSDGYVVTRQPSARILSLFINEHLRTNPNSTVIINSTGNRLKARQFGEVLEVTGIKIASIRDEAHEIGDCEISAANQKSAELLSRYFACSYSTKTSTNFDIEIRIGEDFIDRF